MAYGRFVTSEFASSAKRASGRVVNTSVRHSRFGSFVAGEGARSSTKSTKYIPRVGREVSREVASSASKLSRQEEVLKFLGSHKKVIAGGVAGAIALNAFHSRSGRAADRVRGRPTGMYGF